MITLADALLSLRPGAAWSCKDVYETIVWLDKVQTIPTKEEVEAEINRLQVEYDRNEYQRLREKEYPSWEDQMDILYHQGYEGWRATIQAIKDKYPKPE
jgi:hypothetical protein